MLPCPRCNGKTVVTTSKDLGKQIRRRRKCVSCDYRYTTRETIEPEPRLKK